MPCLVPCQHAWPTIFAPALCPFPADGGEDVEGGASTPRIVLSRQASPHGSPQPACASPAKPSSPTSSDGCRCDATERRFAVKGNWLDGDKRIQLRLRICEPTGKLAVELAVLHAAE